MTESAHMKELFDPRPPKETLKTYDDLLGLIRASEREYDLQLIEKAYQLAEAQHHDQRRLLRRQGREGDVLQRGQPVVQGRELLRAA